MRRSAEEVAASELIGCYLRVESSAHAPFVGLSGVVVDETRNTLVVETADGVVRVPKVGQTFEFAAADGATALLEGADIAHRPEDRVKKSKLR